MRLISYIIRLFYISVKSNQIKSKLFSFFNMGLDRTIQWCYNNAYKTDRFNREKKFFDFRITRNAIINLF